MRNLLNPPTSPDVFAARGLTHFPDKVTLGAMSQAKHALLLAVVTLPWALACGPTGSSDDGNPSVGGASVAVGGSSAAAGGNGAGGTVSVNPAFATRVARLTHTQYENIVGDLFGIDEPVADGFAPDAQNGFAFDSSINYVVDSRLGGQYRGAAEMLAERAATSDDVYTRVVPCDDDSDACRDQFIADFGLRAFRRPLTDAEKARFAGLFARGAELIASGDDFRDGVRLVVEAALESPDFLYRGELGSEPGGSGRVLLSSYELASKLSFFLYNSMPDDELFRAAADDELRDPAEMTRQVERLLDEPTTLRRIVEFHEQAFNFERYSRITLDEETFPDVPSDLASRALNASRLFLEDVITQEGGLKELLTSPFAYADSALAPLYGAEVSGDGFERLELNADERPGLLTQVGFLASHAYAKKTDPIHRGLFVVRDLLCVNIGAPPAGASMQPPPAGSPTPKTTREEVEILTGQDGCTFCHELINPPGFAFEAFDASGKARTTEGDTPVLTSGAMIIDEQPVTFSGAAELVNAVAASEDAAQCYLGKWLDFAHGRDLKDAELAWVAELPPGLSVRELLPRIVSHESFMTRTASEDSP